MARGRGELTPHELAQMKVISENINNLLRINKCKQVDLSKATGIPPSTLTGYIKGRSLPIPGNIEKIANFFNVNKSEIDPRFSDYSIESSTSTEYYIDPAVNAKAEYARTQEGILLDAAKDLTDEELESVINIVNQIRNRNKG